jgi:hypothetical protein
MDYLLDRTKCSFGVSIGTGLMLEAIFDPTEPRYDEKSDLPDRIDIEHYKCHVYNVYTLLRNFISAVKIPPSKTKEKLVEDIKFKTTFLDEVSRVLDLYRDTECTPILFIPEYDKVISNFNRDKKLPSWHEEYKLLNRVIKDLKVEAKEICRVVDGTYKLTTDNLNLSTGLGKKDRVLITTSFACDLLSKIPDMDLLESHTGRLKDKYDWNTKYRPVGNDKLTNIPFMAGFLYIFGDSHMIAPFHLLAAKKMYMEFASKHRWTKLTTYSKVLQDLRLMDHEVFRLFGEVKDIY